MNEHRRRRKLHHSAFPSSGTRQRRRYSFVNLPSQARILELGCFSCRRFAPAGPLTALVECRWRFGSRRAILSEADAEEDERRRPRRAAFRPLSRSRRPGDTSSQSFGSCGSRRHDPCRRDAAPAGDRYLAVRTLRRAIRGKCRRGHHCGCRQAENSDRLVMHHELPRNDLPPFDIP